jgi:hypothetical protein
VLAGYMRIVGPAVLAAFGGRILNTHPSLLPAFPGAHAVRDALAHGARVTGATVHLVDATLDGGPIVAQEAVTILPGDDEASLHERIKAVEHRLLPAAVALLLAGGLGVTGGDTRTVAIDVDGAEMRLPVPRRALLSVSDKTGLAELGRGLVARVRARLDRGDRSGAARGRAARDRRCGGDRARRRCSTAASRPSIRGSTPASSPTAASPTIAASSSPPGSPRSSSSSSTSTRSPRPADRPGITFDELVEEIDIGGPSMVRRRRRTTRAWRS